MSELIKYVKFGTTKNLLLVKHPVKLLDAQEGIKKTKPSFYSFTPFIRTKACYALLNPDDEQDAVVIKAIEGTKAYQSSGRYELGMTNVIFKVKPDYFPPGEKLVDKEETFKREEPKVRLPYQPLFRQDGLWRCSICGWASAKVDRAVLYDHMLVKHGIVDIPTENGKKLVVTDGLYTGCYVHCYKDPRALEQVIRGVRKADDETPVPKANDKVKFIYGTAKGEVEIIGEIVSEKPLMVGVKNEKGIIKNYRKANIKGEIELVR